MLPPADTTGANSSGKLLPPPPPLDEFTAEEFRSRRAALRMACRDGLVLVRGSTQDEVPVGLAARYRQNSWFYYLTGIRTPGALLVLLPDGLSASSGLRGVKPEVREILFLPARSAVAETWTGAELGPGEETEKLAGIERAMDVSRAWPAISLWLKRNPVIYTIAPYGDGARGTREYGLMQRVIDHAPIAQFRDASSELAKLRVVKSAVEVERLRQAIAATSAGQQAAREIIARGGKLHEYEVEARVLESFRSQGATLAFASIVGGGVNATVLHYEENSAELKEGELVVVDVGARIGPYGGDLTRTYPVGGRFGRREREVYDLVHAVHEHAVAHAKPGADTIINLDERCKQFLKDSPLRSRDGAGEEKTMDHFMPHNLGHFLGLDVHDVGDREKVLQPGNVLTIEPGIYLPAEGIGVRLEDDYLVTETGLERLSPEPPLPAQQLESTMRAS
jgi:Xaa-Pro aminopeptidase